MKISALHGDARDVEVEFGDEPDAPVLHLSYDPTKYTPALEAKFEEISASDFQTKAIVIFLAVILTSWDLEDDSGPVPLTEEGMANVPVAILGKILAGIQKSALPSSEEGKDSGVGSAQTARTGSSLPGTA